MNSSFFKIFLLLLIKVIKFCPGNMKRGVCLKRLEQVRINQFIQVISQPNLRGSQNDSHRWLQLLYFPTLCRHFLATKCLFSAELFSRTLAVRVSQSNTRVSGISKFYQLPLISAICRTQLGFLFFRPHDSISHCVTKLIVSLNLCPRPGA